MRAYYFCGSKNGLSNIEKRRVKISRLLELNDLFEFYAVEVRFRWQRDLLRKTLEKLNPGSGLVCFSKSWKSPVMWGHYADKYQGMCFGFDISDNLIHQVSYVSSRFPWPEKEDSEEFIKKLLYTKFSHWSYEDEYRVYASINTEEDGISFLNFDDNLKLRQVIVGPRCETSRKDVFDRLKELDGVECFKARAAFKSFEVRKNEKSELWK